MLPKSKDTCEECGLAVPKGTSLVEHAEMHVREKPYQCNFCYLAYSNIKELGEHVRGHADEPDPNTVECDVCKALWPVEKIDLHKKAHAAKKGKRLDKGEVKCGLCNLVCDNMSKLFAHTKQHRESGPFECGGCTKKFSTVLQLSKHECSQRSTPTRRTSLKRKFDKSLGFHGRGRGAGTVCMTKVRCMNL